MITINLISSILTLGLGSFFAYRLMWLVFISPVLNTGGLGEFNFLNLIILIAVSLAGLIIFTLALYVLFQYGISHMGYSRSLLTAKTIGILLILAGILFAFVPVIHGTMKNAEAAGWLLLVTVPTGLVSLLTGVVILIVRFIKRS